jgi:hypothetical protein
MRFRCVAALLVFLLSSAGLALAQETTGSIKGKIVDAQALSVPGVNVTATGTQGAKSTTSDTDGRFNLSFLTPGAYTLRAELQGFKTVEQKDINVALGQTVDLALKMEVGAVNQIVEVIGAGAGIDKTSTTIGAVLETSDLAQVPVGRRFSDTLYLSPGVSSSGTLGTSNPSVSGGTGLENEYIVDGANVTNTGYGGLGSYSTIFGSLGNATPYDFIKEVQVKTGGYEAEYGQANGGVINALTKSGSNDFRGSVFGFSQPSKLDGTWTQFQAANGSVSTISTQVNDIGAGVGGPLIKDHLFFFGSIDPSWQTRTFQAPPGFALASLGNLDRDRRTVAYATKGTLQLGSGQRIDASFFGDPSHGATGPQRTSALLVGNTASFSSLDYGGHQQTVRYSGVITSHWLAEATFARSLNDISELPSVDTWRITDQTVTPTQITGGIGGYEKGNHSLNYQYSANATNIIGSNAIKYGGEYDDVTYSQLNSRTGPTFTDPNGRVTATGASITILSDPAFGKIYRVTRANFNSGHLTTQKYADFFVQDSWKVGNRLTVNPGVRYDQETISGDFTKNWQLKNNWAPRIGAALDVTGDGKTKVYGNYGRFYARIPNDLAARALSADDGVTRIDYFDAGLTRPIPAGTLARGTTVHYIPAGVAVDVLDPNTKLTYENEVVLGFEREVMPGTTFGARYIFRNMPRIIEDVANCPFAAYDLGIPACASVDYILTNPSSATPINPAVLASSPAFAGVSFADPVHKYNALEVTLNHRSARWNAIANYRYSRLRGNFEGFYRDDNTQSDPAISSLYDFPQNDPTYTSIGVPRFGYAGDVRFLGDPNGILPLDRPHQVKIYGNYLFSMGLNLGIGVNLSSGKPLTPMAANPNYDSPGEIPVAARGTGIQTIDGFLTRTPFESQVDLQASYAIKFGGSRRLTLLGEVFNLFNERRTIGYDQDTELNASTTNPDFGKPVNSLLGGTPAQFQAPISVRLGVRLEF